MMVEFILGHKIEVKRWREEENFKEGGESLLHDGRALE